MAAAVSSMIGLIFFLRLHDRFVVREAEAVTQLHTRTAQSRRKSAQGSPSRRSETELVSLHDNKKKKKKETELVQHLHLAENKMKSTESHALLSLARSLLQRRGWSFKRIDF